MPLPAETNPRFVFERRFGSGDTAEERLARVQEDRSILDGLSQEISRLSRKLGGHDRPSSVSISMRFATWNSA